MRQTERQNDTAGGNSQQPGQCRQRLTAERFGRRECPGAMAEEELAAGQERETRHWRESLTVNHVVVLTFPGLNHDTATRPARFVGRV